MTLNAVIAFILRFSLNLTDFQADYITVVEDYYYYYYYRKKRFRRRNVKRLQGHLTNAKDSDKTRVRRKV